MAKPLRIFWLHALTPLHVGTGQGVGFIDLPVMREKATGWPLVPGSAVKGVRRDAADDGNTDKSLFKAAFGQADPGEGESEQDNAGSLVFTDARLVCLPVRSLLGTFAWVTAPLVLQRLRRNLEAAGEAEELPKKFDIGGEQAHIAEKPFSVLGSEDGKVYLEDLDFPTKSCSTAQSWAEKLAEWIFPGDATWQALFIERFVVLPNDSFNFLCGTATEVNARIRIDQQTKTVAGGALWYEESLPAETILAGMVWCDRVLPKDTATPEDLLGTYCSGELKLQIGGKATIGKGRVRCLFSGGS
ncbi:MAG: type III-B CRISPR module RAMP protein Cmr4 [Candidatus Competibacteraceae bacterium]